MRETVCTRPSLQRPGYKAIFFPYPVQDYLVRLVNSCTGKVLDKHCDMWSTMCMCVRGEKESRNRCVDWVVSPTSVLCITHLFAAYIACNTQPGMVLAGMHSVVVVVVVVVALLPNILLCCGSIFNNLYTSYIFYMLLLGITFSA